MSLLQRTGEAGSPAALGGREVPLAALAHGKNPGAWKQGAIALLILAVAYGVLQNGRWVSGTDTGYYLSIAKNLVVGKGYTFNGGPVKLIPPLWPLVLAAAMKISTSFWFLNLMPMAGMLMAAGLWYRVLLRLTTPRRAAITVVVSGLLFYSYMSAAQLRTEALFCAALAGATLLAMQVSEGKGGAGRVGLLCALVSALVLTRWIGITAAAVVAAALLSGRKLTQPTIERGWVLAGVTLVVATLTFFTARLVLQNLGDKPEMDYNTIDLSPAERKSGKVDREDMDVVGSGGGPIQGVLTGKGFVAGARSFMNAGKWVSGLVWMPAYIGVTDRKIGLVTNAVGWILIALFGVVAWRDARTAQRWLWIGVALYCASLIFRMRDPNPRYFVPVAPLLLMGVWLGADYLAGIWKNRARGKLARLAAPVVLVSALLVNGALWAVDVWVFRSTDFYSSYRAGNMDRLFSAARYLIDRQVASGQVAVSPYYQNLGRPKPRRNGEGLRAMALLTGVGIRAVPEKLGTQPNPALAEWMSKKQVRYYLYRPPESPWRAHHFRIAKVQSLRTNVPVEQIPTNPSWELYELSHGKLQRVPLGDPGDWPTRVPGI